VIALKVSVHSSISILDPYIAECLRVRKSCIEISNLIVRDSMRSIKLHHRKSHRNAFCKAPQASATFYFSSQSVIFKCHTLRKAYLRLLMSIPTQNAIILWALQYILGTQRRTNEPSEEQQKDNYHGKSHFRILMSHYLFCQSALSAFPSTPALYSERNQEEKTLLLRTTFIKKL